MGCGLFLRRAQPLGYRTDCRICKRGWRAVRYGPRRNCRREIHVRNRALHSVAGAKVIRPTNDERRTANTDPLQLALTYHVEGPADRPSSQIYEEHEKQVLLADELGFDYAWFSEHHANAHYGHLPTPLFFALHLAQKTARIKLGTAIICLNLHHPVAVAELVAVADHLSGGRLSVGFGSGSTPEEFQIFGLDVTDARVRHERFEGALQIIKQAWTGTLPSWSAQHFQVPAHNPLPVARPDLLSRCWLACNSVDSSIIAGKLGFNMMFSHLRTPDQYREYSEVYRNAGGAGLIAANRPIYVGADDESAFQEAEPALRTLWRRFHREGKIPSEKPEPHCVQELCDHPINFLVGGPETVARQIRELGQFVHFDVLNLEPEWKDLTQSQVHNCLRRIANEVHPLLK
jgi:alkanesulfonate monooxygenase SsuD/methylene tetrahydromethanopterin reductase-like flavin-dependent oxidoreductase (luciferase family)